MAPTDTEKNNTMHEEEAVQMLQAHEKTSGDLLPSPVSATSPRPASSSKPKLSAATIIPIWIVLSSAVIIYNNYLYNTLQFRFPVFLVTWHLTFAVSTSFSFVLLHGRILWVWLPSMQWIVCYSSGQPLCYAASTTVGTLPLRFSAVPRDCTRHLASFNGRTFTVTSAPIGDGNSGLLAKCRGRMLTLRSIHRAHYARTLLTGI